MKPVSFASADDLTFEKLKVVADPDLQRMIAVLDWVI